MVTPCLHWALADVLGWVPHVLLGPESSSLGAYICHQYRWTRSPDSITSWMRRLSRAQPGPGVSEALAAFPEGLGNPTGSKLRRCNLAY